MMPIAICNSVRRPAGQRPTVQPDGRDAGFTHTLRPHKARAGSTSRERLVESDDRLTQEGSWSIALAGFRVHRHYRWPSTFRGRVRAVAEPEGSGREETELGDIRVPSLPQNEIEAVAQPRRGEHRGAETLCPND